MIKLDIELSQGGYPIYIGEGALKKIEKLTEKYEKILILSNEKVGKLYFDKLKLNLTTENIYYYEVEDGEEYKSYNSAEKIYDFLIENNFYRNSVILTLGGGVITDLGGYIAGSYMRGIDYIQIPTTLLAQVDASIGGKVAINHKGVKNLIGFFYQPKGVIIEPGFLETLEEKEIKSGLGEIIKHSLISKNSQYFEFLNENSEKIENLELDILERVIFESCKIKKEIVERDEKEQGDRVFLNLGHTYAHGLESIYGLKNITHGESVAKGIIYELNLFNRVNSELYLKVINLFKKFKIDSTPVLFDDNRLIEVLKKDKKNTNDKISFIEMKNLGELYLKKVDYSEIIRGNNRMKDVLKREIVGVIDIGTNSTRIFISEIERGEKCNKIIRPILKRLEITSLGKGVNENRMLSEEGMERVLSAIKSFKKIGEEYGVTEIKAYGTSAVRDSKNRDEFIRRVENLGVTMECIEGEIEAKLSFIGISSVYTNKKIGIIDIGGGSTEVSIGCNDNIEFTKSFDVGAVRVTEMFFQSKDEKTGETVENYSLENIEKARNWIKGVFSPLNNLKFDLEEFLGVAGTVSKQVTIKEKMDIYDEEKVNGYILNIEDIRDNYNMLVGKNLEERKCIPGLEPKRAEYVISGTLILLVLLEDVFKRDEIKFSEIDNLEGSTIYFTK